MKNKKALLGLVALALVMALMLGVYLTFRPETEAGRKTFTVVVTHSDGGENRLSYETEEEYLGAVLLEQGLIQGEEGAYGLMISTVDGETADWDADRSYWALYIGEEYATTGVDTTSVTDGGEYRLVYANG